MGKTKEQLLAFWEASRDKSPLAKSAAATLARLEARAAKADEKLAEKWPSSPGPAKAPPIVLIGFVVAFALLLWRGMHLLYQPDFYIEDGREFYQNAHNLGLPTLWRQYARYYHVFPRLASLFADLFPVRFGPIVLMLIAVALQAATAAFLLSSRLARQFPSLWARAMLALLVVAYPYADELYGNIAHSQWYLAVLAAAIICAEPAKRAFARVRDVVVLFVAALTGPFSLVLAPIANVAAWRDRRLAPHATVLSVGAVVTFLSLPSHPRVTAHRTHRFPLILRMISNQVTVGSSAGFAGLKGQEYEPFFTMTSLALTLIAVGLIWYGARKGPQFLRALAWLGAFTVATVLISEASWRILGSPGVAERYFFFLGLAFLASILLVVTKSRRATVRWTARAFGLYLAVGIVANWVYPEPHTRFGYLQQITTYDRITKGTKLEIKTSIDRRSDASWTMELVKK
jgi:hypothetical protein